MNLRKLALVLVASLSLAACGGGAAEEHVGPPGGQHGEYGGGGEHDAALPATLDAFHDVLAPAWHSEPGATRSTAACTAAPSLRERAGTVQSDAAPEGVDAAAWTEATAALVSTSDALVATCAEQGADGEAKLGAVHEAFHALLEQVRGGH
jgi:hypothetical protein